MRKHLLILFICGLTLVPNYLAGLFGAAIKTELKFEDGKYTLYRQGKPYYVNGAGCEFGNIVNLAGHGANSMRTWRTNNGKQSAQEILDLAYKHGLTVLMGLEVHKERHGFDYNDSVRVQQQLDSIKLEILKYKDHPALLGWAIGNELNLRGANPKVWDAVNDISKMIHEVDGNHPTTTPLAGVPKETIADIKVRCTDLDFLSFQVYGSVIRILESIKEAQWTGAYMITEWGATGHWEVPKTSWGIPIEETSTEKANAILERWNKAVKANTTQCLGSYVFIWEQKQERTPTWYGLLTENGEETEATDVMEFCWTGKWPANRAPSIDSVFIDGLTRYDSIRLAAGSEAHVQVFSTDREGDSLRIWCEILPDIAANYRHGGDFERRPPTIVKKEIMPFTQSIPFRVPNETGPYRFFIYVSDGRNNVGTANLPFFVESLTK